MFYSYQDLRQLAVTSSKLTMKLSKNYVKFAQLSTNGLVFSFALNFLLLTFRKWQNFFWYFSCWLWTNKCRLGKIILSLFILVMLLYQLIKMLIDTLQWTNPISSLCPFLKEDWIYECYISQKNDRINYPKKQMGVYRRCKGLYKN